MAILDTNFLIALHDGDEDALELLASIQQEPLLVPAIVAAEFLTPYGKAAAAAHDALARSFTLVHTDDGWTLAAAALRRRLAGKTARLADLWIAVWAHLHDTPVVTRNTADFAHFGVQTVSW